MRKRSTPDPFEVFLAYFTARLIDDPHLQVGTLCDELEDLGYTLSYQTLHRKIRELKLRPICQACLTATERPNAVIEHPLGEETQWGWVDLPNPPASWGSGSMAHLFVGTLACSGKWRGILAPDMTQPRVVDGLDRICRGNRELTFQWTAIYCDDSPELHISLHGRQPSHVEVFSLCDNPADRHRAGDREV